MSLCQKTEAVLKPSGLWFSFKITDSSSLYSWHWYSPVAFQKENTWNSLLEMAFLFVIYFSLTELGLCPVADSGGYSGLWYSGFSLWWLLLLQSTGPKSPGFSSCGTWAYLLHGMWNIPRPGVEPMSPPVAGRFLAAGPLGRSGNDFSSMK